VNRALLVRAGALYVPLMAALLAGLLRRPGRRVLAGCLLSVLWAMTSLVVLQRLNEACGWWTFAGGDVLFCAMPVELYLGWALLWGIMPQMMFRRLELRWVAAAMAGFDLVAMPLCRPVVMLGPRWLMGEALAVALVLLPALCVARWTAEDSHLRVRAALQVAISGLLFLLLVPELTFRLRPGRGWAPLLGAASWVRQLELQGVCLLALPGVAAVMEFAQRGLGTPIPYDPPRRLVTSGVYRYCANPMQMSCAVVMLAWAAVLRNGWLVLAALVSAVYSVGIATWDEGEDLEQRFGSEWRAYRVEVRNWRWRWRPYVTGADARLYVARTCGPCREVRAWIEARRPVGMVMVDAETLAAGSIRRMRYDPGDGSAPVEGVRAMGRALEHLHAGWALCGAALRLPGIWWVAQVVMDASGLGPREVCGVDQAPAREV
jgi:protein-S-isoprenylcysteine O-methyltransferase Ste14